MTELLQVPWLREGKGDSPAEGGCIMQVIDWIDRCEWTDEPPCVHPILASIAITANDLSSDRQRQRLLALAPRLMRTDSADPKLVFDLSAFAVERILWLHERRVARVGLQAARTWSDNPEKSRILRYLEWEIKEERSQFQAHMLAFGVLSAVAGIISSARRMCDVDEARNACYWVSRTITLARRCNEHVDSLDFLVAMLDEYDRLTGRSKVMANIDWQPVCKVMSTV